MKSQGCLPAVTRDTKQEHVISVENTAGTGDNISRIIHALSSLVFQQWLSDVLSLGLQR